jgi:hypothetical protein
MCNELSVVTINGAPFCVGHVDDGFRLIARALGIEKGMDPDDAERKLVGLVRVLHERGEL